MDARSQLYSYDTHAKFLEDCLVVDGEPDATVVSSAKRTCQSA